METRVRVDAIVSSREELVLILGVADTPQVAVSALSSLVIGFKFVNQLHNRNTDN